MSSVLTMLRPIGAALAGAKPAYVLLAIAVYALSVPVAAFRWRTVLRGLHHDAPMGRLMLINLAAIFVNNVTPASRLGGEACRVLALVRGRIAATSIAVLSIVYERISEIPSIAFLVVVALVVAGRGLPTETPFGVAVAVLAVCVLGAVAVRLAPVIRRRVRAVITTAMTSRVFAAAAAISAAVWVLDVMRLWTAAAAIGTSVSFGQAVTLSAITVAAGLVPSIGGLGVIEGGLVGGLVAFGVQPAEAAAITAIERAISYGLASLAGAGALSALGGRALWNAARTRGDEVAP